MLWYSRKNNPSELINTPSLSPLKSSRVHKWQTKFFYVGDRIFFLHYTSRSFIRPSQAPSNIQGPIESKYASTELNPCEAQYILKQPISLIESCWGFSVCVQVWVGGLNIHLLLYESDFSILFYVDFFKSWGFNWEVFPMGTFYVVSNIFTISSNLRGCNYVQRWLLIRAVS